MSDRGISSNSLHVASGSLGEVVAIGEELLDYVSDLGKIKEKIQSAYAIAILCRENVQDEETYQGEALEEMEAFFVSLEAHLQKLIFLYQTAMAYVGKVYTEMHYSEEQLISWTMKEIQGEW